MAVFKMRGEVGDDLQQAGFIGEGPDGTVSMDGDEVPGGDDAVVSFLGFIPGGGDVVLRAVEYGDGGSIGGVSDRIGAGNVTAKNAVFEQERNVRGFETGRRCRHERGQGEFAYEGVENFGAILPEV